ncbi:hypothetical protein KAF25_001660 [Fusarium avenaceum]|uniref:Conidiation-specific expression protein n=1 Tax=Fusarium avenaceum TaxID=40199 RepID=A0A9P7KL73_9HYPO|nr:hypothetical protein KAF25_001660 [Fusarium avenaceum]
MDSGAPQVTPTDNTSGRRRSSGFMPAFAGLHEQKRGSDASAARRASMTDQQAKGGMFSQFFHNNFGKNANK